MLLLATIGVPFGIIVFWLLHRSSAVTSPVLASPELLLGATLFSIGYGISGAALTLLLAAPLAFLASRYGGPLVTIIERAAYLAQGVPGLVIALSLIAIAVHRLRPSTRPRTCSSSLTPFCSCRSP